MEILKIFNEQKLKDWIIFIQACLFVIFCAVVYLTVSYVSRPSNVKECILDSTKSAEALRGCVYAFR